MGLKDIIELLLRVRNLEKSEKWQGFHGDTELSEVNRVDFGATFQSAITKFWFTEKPGDPQVELRGESFVDTREIIKRKVGGVERDTERDDLVISTHFGGNKITRVVVEYKYNLDGQKEYYKFIWAA
jgi:hypothetical protein